MFVRFINEETEKIKRCADLDLVSTEEPIADIIAFVGGDEDDIKEAKEKGYEIVAKDKIQDFLDKHQNERVAIVHYFVEYDPIGQEPEWNFDIYYPGVNAFVIHLDNEDLEKSDEELRKIIEEETTNQMGYDFNKFGAIIFEGREMDEGISDYPIVKIEKVIRKISKRND
jgi:hypothetical protein